MHKFGFNSIDEEARKCLEKEGILVEQHVETMIDVVAPYNFRVWYRIDEYTKEKIYYYLFKDKVYWAVNEIKKDYSTNPPTQHVVCILHVVDEWAQDKFRDKLLSFPEDLDSVNGGVMK